MQFLRDVGIGAIVVIVLGLPSVVAMETWKHGNPWPTYCLAVATVVVVCGAIGAWLRQ